MTYLIRGYNNGPLFINDMGSIASFLVTETRMSSKEDEVLWYLNSMRRHDGLEEYQSIEDIPVTITFTPQEEVEDHA